MTLLHRLLYGFSFTNARDPSKKLQHLKRSYITVCVTSLLLAVSTLYFIIRFSTFVFTPTFDSYELHMPDLAPEEQEHVRRVLKDFKPVCSKVIKSMTIARNITPFLVEHGSYEKGDDEWTSGFNPGLGPEIYVKYRDSHSLKETVTHETLHSVMRASDEAHGFIYEISKGTPCFYGSRRLEVYPYG